VLILKNEEYSEQVKEIMKQLSGMNLCFVATNMMVDLIIKDLKKNNIDYSNFYFIDYVSRSAGDNFKEIKNCKYVDWKESPVASLRFAVNLIMTEKKVDLFFINELGPVINTSHLKEDVNLVEDILDSMKEEAKLIIIALKSDLDEGYVEGITRHVDKVIEV